MTNLSVKFRPLNSKLRHDRMISIVSCHIPTYLTPNERTGFATILRYSSTPFQRLYLQDLRTLSFIPPAQDCRLFTQSVYQSQAYTRSSGGTSLTPADS